MGQSGHSAWERLTRTLGTMVEALLTKSDDIPGAQREAEEAASRCSNAMGPKETEDARYKREGR